ncbi:hypothetical protein DFP72DRAFT_882417 [Ephemerocybe angulata]|uniref:Uncharacterized protein n=1 Tax=Ephemerocybe angulata TaxID=980116 RepID=A0A8H6I9V7_9AGAR|nr:hypothetical protein DFP72DRAFT_882417 [Tulosesus angulatus]
MLQGRPRELLKGLLIQSRIKFVYDRITDTRYTRFYFILSGFTCLLLCALQGVILSDSAKAVEILTAAVEEADPPPHITILKDGELQVCDRIPDRRDASCIVLWLKDREASQSSGLSRREKRRLRRRQARPPNSSDSEDDNSNSGQSDGSNSNGQSSNSDSQSSDDERGLNAPKQAAPRVSTNSTGKLRPSSTVNTTAPRASTTVLRLNRKDTVRRRQVKGSKVGSSDGSNSDGQNSNDSQSDRNSSSGRRPSRTSTRTSTATASTTATQPTATVLKLKREDTLATLAASARSNLRRRQGQPPNSSSASEGDSPSGESDGNESVSSDDELAEAPPPPPPASTTSTTTVASSTSTSPSSSSSSTSSSTLSTVSTTTTRTSSASAPASSSSTTSTSTSTVPPSTTTSVTVSSTTSVTVSSSTTANGSTTVTISSSSSTAFPQSSSTFTATTAPSSSGSVSTASTASTKSTVTPSGSTSTTPATLSSSTDAATTSSQSTSTRATSSPSATTSASGTTTTGTSSTKGTPTSTSTTTEITGISLNQSSGVSPHSMSCIYSMSWLEEVLHDSQREDVALFFFELWLFGLGLAAILNESLPHLGAAFFGRVLAGAWASSRIHSAKALAAFYRNSIVASPCQGADLLGSLWEVRLAHTVPVVAFNIVGLLTKVYANVTFTRLGLSISLQKMYMLVLFFSVCLQLGSFFTAASMGLWIAKVGHGSFKALSQHLPLYLAAFVAVLVLVIPWFILGWKSVRNESRKRFGAYLALSMFLLGISGIMFSRDTYRTIFLSWSFFATITVTAFVLLVFAVITGLACFLNFGKGLSAYLQSNEKLEGEDFTPIYGEKRATMRRTMKPYPFVPFISEKTDPEWSAAKLQEARSNPKLAPVQTPSMKSSIRRAASRVQSAWSAYSADGVNAKGPPPLPKNLHLQVPPSTLLPNGRVPSGVSSIVPFQGLPFPPPSSIREAASPTVPTSGRDSIGSLIERLSPVSVPMTPQPYLPSRASSIRSIRQSPFPTIPVLNLPSRASSIRSIRKPPFNSTAPITNRQSGATSIMDNYLNPFQSAPSSARESMVSFVTSTTQEVSHSRGSPDIREVQRDVV